MDGRLLPTLREEVAARQAEAVARQRAEAAQQAEAQARRQAEAEVARLRRELERLGHPPTAGQGG